MVITSEVKKIYTKLQKQLFYLIPEKWDRIYLYASVNTQMLELETGELFFYYFPKGILKKKPINVYEIPNRFNLNEEEYIKLVEKLYITIKELRQVYINENAKLWSSITIKIERLKFEVEFNYEDLTYSKYSNMQKHMIWKYKYLDLPLESFEKADRRVIQDYLSQNEENIEIYSENMYMNSIKNIIGYNKENVQRDVKKSKKENIKKVYINKHYTYMKNKRKKEKTESISEDIKSQILNH